MRWRISSFWPGSFWNPTGGLQTPTTCTWGQRRAMFAAARCPTPGAAPNRNTPQRAIGRRRRQQCRHQVAARNTLGQSPPQQPRNPDQRHAVGQHHRGAGVGAAQARRCDETARYGRRSASRRSGTWPPALAAQASNRSTASFMVKASIETPATRTRLLMCRAPRDRPGPRPRPSTDPKT